jgi:CDGSH-type Zn-finger protein
MSDVTITIRKDGPLKVDGPVTLVDHEGNEVETREGKAIFLCRCGGSKRKPFCDGAHSRIGFAGAEAAVAAAEAESED